MSERFDRRLADAGLPADARSGTITAWLRAPETASSRVALDAAFAQVAQLRRQPRRPWSGITDSLFRPISLELPRWAWIALVGLVLVALGFAAMVGSSELRAVLDRRVPERLAPAILQPTSCPSELSAATDVVCDVATVDATASAAGNGASLRVTTFGVASVADLARAGTTPILYLDALDPLGEHTRADVDRFARVAGRPIVAVALPGSAAGTDPLRCSEVEAVSRATPGATLGDPAFRDAIESAFAACHARLASEHRDHAAYGPATAALDLSRIRRGLGIDRWFVRLAGRDAAIGLELLKADGDGIAGLLLVDPILGAPGTASGVDHGVASLTDLCLADSFCRTRYGSPADALSRALERVASRPVVAATAGLGGTAVAVDSEVVRAAVSDGLAGSTSLSILPSRLHALSTGDLSWTADRLVARGWCLGADLACTDATGWSSGVDVALGCGTGTVDAAAGLDAAGDPWSVACRGWAATAPAPAPDSWRTASPGVPVVAIVAAVSPRSTAAAMRVAFQGRAGTSVIEVPWAPEAIELTCLGPSGANWFNDPALPPEACPAVVAPRFADAP